MKFLAAILALFITTALQAQVQFWNIRDIEDQTFMAARKANKVREVRVYQTGENGIIKDSTDVEELLTYNTNGQLLTSTTWKYDWNKRQRFIQSIDSFFYNPAGQLTFYKAFEGPDRRQVYETVVTLNAKGQLTRMDNYNFFNGYKELEAYDLFTWNAKKQVTQQVLYKAPKKKDATRLFTYNPAGRLIKQSFKDLGAGMSNTYTWNTQGQLTAMQEQTGKDPGKKVTYTYDAAGRRTKKETTTTYNYDDFTEYRYSGASTLPTSTYLQYPGYSNNKNDRRHEYRVFVYGY